jgi:hypothetical protein
MIFPSCQTWSVSGLDVVTARYGMKFAAGRNSSVERPIGTHDPGIVGVRFG